MHIRPGAQAVSGAQAISEAKTIAPGVGVGLEWGVSFACSDGVRWKGRAGDPESAGGPLKPKKRGVGRNPDG